MKNNKIRVKIYGVRGSFPPTNGNGTKYGVNTTCLRIDIGKHIIIIDAGTGIINLGSDLISEWKSGKNKQNYFKLFLFFTHTHIDHLMGFPYFNMLYMPQTELNIISPIQLNYSIEEILDTIMSPAFFPVTLAELACTFTHQDFSENRMAYFFEDDFRVVSINDRTNIKNWIGRISCMRNYTHPKGGVYVYKIENPSGKSVVFATDIEGFVGGDQRLINFAKKAEILIHDAQYSLSEYELFQGFGHSTYKMACDVAKKASVKKLVLSHHDPKHADDELIKLEEQARSEFPETHMASETMEFFI